MIHQTLFPFLQMIFPKNVLLQSFLVLVISIGYLNECVGTSVGVLVGVGEMRQLFAKSVRILVGESVGIFVGLSVGERVGVEVGLSVGIFVDESVDISVGAGVGLLLGAGVGELVIRTVGAGEGESGDER